MKLLPFYLCLLAIIFQAIFTSTFLADKHPSLSADKESGISKPKKAVGKLVSKRKLRNTNNKSLMTKNKRGRKNGKSKDILVKEDKSKLLIELLPKELVKLVISYFNDDTYPFIVSTHSWLLNDRPAIAVDSARVYLLTKLDGLKGLNHSLANVKENDRRLIEFGNSQWFNYWPFSSSHDGQCVFFGYTYKALTNREEQVKYGRKWLMQSNVPEDGSFKPVPFEGEELHSGLLSRNGQTLCSYSHGVNPITRVYQVREEAGKDPAALKKFDLDGKVLAVSGNDNRIMVINAGQLEIHDISEDKSKLVCQVDGTDVRHTCALNEDGSKAAFATYNAELQIVEVDKVVGNKIDQPAIITVKAPKSVETIFKLVYFDGGKLCVFHDGGKISLFNSSTKELILLEFPQEAQLAIDMEISPNADYIAFLQKSDTVGEKGKSIYRTIVKRKLNEADFERLFG